MRRLLGSSLFLLLAALVMPLGSASADTWTATPLDKSGLVENVRTITVAPDGRSRFFVSDVANGKPFLYGDRPSGGALGELMAHSFYYYASPDKQHDAAGNLYVRSSYVVERMALDGTKKTADIRYLNGPGQTTGARGEIRSIRVAPSGDVLIASDDWYADGGKVYLTLWAADGTLHPLADFAPSESAPYVLTLGIALDPDGGMVVVYREAGTQRIFQSVRGAEDDSFDEPAEIVQPVLGDAGYIQMVSGASGHALLTWSTEQRLNPPAPEPVERHIIGAVRTPGHAFTAPEVIGNDAWDATPAITDSGDGMVFWSQTTVRPGCEDMTPGPGVVDWNSHLYAATLHDGELSGGVPFVVAGPDEQNVLWFVRSGGNRLVVDVRRSVLSHGVCTDPDVAVSHQQKVLNGGGSGFVEDSTLPLGEGEEITTPPVAGAPPNVAIGANGTIMAITAQSAPEGWVYRIWSNDGPVFAAGGGGDDNNGPGPGDTTPPQNPLPPSTKPIAPPIPKSFVTPSGAITTKSATVTVKCPAGYSSCKFLAAVQGPRTAGLAALMDAQVAAKKKKDVKLGSVKATIKAGAKKKLKIKLTKAGKQAAKSKRAKKVWLISTITQGDRKATSKLRIKIGGKAKPKKKAKKK